MLDDRIENRYMKKQVKYYFKELIDGKKINTQEIIKSNNASEKSVAFF